MKTLLLFLAAAAGFLCAADLYASSELVCAGSTFAAPLYQKWIADFQKSHPGAALSYRAIGSKSGLDALRQGAVDFAATDFAPAAAERRQYALEAIPTVIGAAVPVYNLPQLRRELHFTPKLLAAIYSGRVTRWNDPELAVLNRGAKLPDAPIVVFHRSDGSGTSYLWSDFLSAADPEWKSKVGVSTTPRWPTGSAAAGSQGMVEEVAKTPNALGYVELIYALQAHLSTGAVRNAAGAFVSAGIDTIAAAASGAERDESGSVSLLQAGGARAYPIAGITWFIVSTRTSPAKRPALQAFVDWALTSGQSEAGALGFVSLPPAIAQQGRERVAHVLGP